MQEKKEKINEILWRIEGKIDIIGQIAYENLVEDKDKEEIVNWIS